MANANPLDGGTNVGRFQYTGQAWLPEAGLYYYKARMYSPTLGRFMQTDPIGYADGMNMYAYVGNDPVNFRDPTGLDAAGGNANACENDPANCIDVLAEKWERWRWLYGISPSDYVDSFIPRTGVAASQGGTGNGGNTPQSGDASSLEDTSKDILVTARAQTLKWQSRRGDGKHEWIVQPLASRDSVWYELRALFGGEVTTPRDGVWVLHITPESRVI